MKKALLFITALLAVLGCTELPERNPYEGSLCRLIVQVNYPEGYAQYVREGIPVWIEEVNLGSSYYTVTEADGQARFLVPEGLYRVSINDVTDDDIFNGTADKVKVTDSSTILKLAVLHSVAGSIIIKEIYCGGCKRLPQEGDYQADQYVILHNNDYRVQYLDGLCIGGLFPYNAMATNPFISKDVMTGETIYQDYVPIAEAVWQFGGDGTKFPLEPGEDAVVCLRGAIDHTVQFPLSVNLDKPDYFVCYNSTYFTNTTYHPVPGPNISQDRYLEVVAKTGISNAYAFSVNSPAVVLYRAQGMTMREFMQTPNSIIPIPGSGNSQVAAIPHEWVVDAVEVFSGTSSANAKRLMPSLDAGYVTLSDTYLGHTLHRVVDMRASMASGYEVLMDTNNSSIDFYESEKQSLHE